MPNLISIVHAPHDGAESELVHLAYTITDEDGIYTISCALQPQSERVHLWLSLRRFDVRLRRENGTYTMLHNARNDTWSGATSSFIDAVWAAILKREAWVCV